MRESTSRPNLSVPRQMHRRTVDGAEQMPLGRDQPEEPVGCALDEEAEDLRVVVIRSDGSAGR